MTFILKPVEDSLIQPDFDQPLWERLIDPDAHLTADDFDYLLDLYRGDMARATELRNAAKLLVERADSIEAKAQSIWGKFVDRLRGFILAAIAEQGGKRREFVLRKHVLKVRKAQPKLEVLDDIRFTELYKNTVLIRADVVYKIDRKAVRTAIDNGTALTGASLVEQPDSVILEMGGVE